MLIFRFDGFIDTQESLVPFKVRIERPISSSKSEYFCTVEVSPLLVTAKHIFGSDAAQATTLALRFLRTIVSGYRVYDAKKESIQFDDLLKEDLS